MRIFAVLLLTLALAAAPGDWVLGEASSVSAHGTPAGVLVVANVDLPDPCHEAMIREVHGWMRLGKYEIVVRVKPADLQKACIQVITPAQIKREFILLHAAKTVTVETRNKTFTVPVR